MDNNLTSCPECSNQYDSPRILPCGITICGNCITKSVNSNNFICRFCDQKHPVPLDGFPANKLAINILNHLETKNFYRGSVFEQFKAKMNNVQELLDYVNMNYEQAKLTINDYFSDLKNQIIIDHEEKVRELSDSKEKLFKEIDTYEIECLNNLDSQKNLLTKYSSFSKEEKKIYDFYKDDLKKTGFNEVKLRDNISRIKKTEWDLLAFKRRLRNFLFKNVNYNVILNDKICRIKKMDLKHIDFGKYQKIELSKKINFNITYGVNLKLLENDHLVLNYIDNDFHKTEIYNYPGVDTLLFNRKTKISKDLKYILLEVFKTKIVSFKSVQNDNQIFIFNDKLKLEKFRNSDHDIKQIACSKNRILGLSLKSDTSESTIHVFDWELNELMIIQRGLSLFYFKDNLKRLWSNEEYFFLQEEKLVHVISQEDGRREEYLMLNDIVYVDSNSICYLYDNWLKVVNFNGIEIETKKIFNFKFNSNSHFFKDKNENFVIYDSNEPCLYVKNN